MQEKLLVRIKQDNRKVDVSISNWPLLVDLFVKWGYHEEILEEAKTNSAITLKVVDLNKVTKELSDWEIQWKREY